MKKILGLVATAVIVASMASSALAQAAGPTGNGSVTGGQQQGKQGKHGARLGNWGISKKEMKELNLSPDQQKKVEELNKKTLESLKALREKAGTDKKGARKEMMEIRKGYEDAIKAILTPAQLEQLKKAMEEAKDKAKKGGKPGNGGGAATGGTGTGTTGGGTTGGGL